MKTNWQPTASLCTLQQRAHLLQQIRAFFQARNILEVDTPLLQSTTVTDPYIQSIQTQYGFLQTSPEYAMKRLLAADSGDIFQICKAFRAEESGRLHHFEFTLLEWYRLGFDHHALMDDMDALLQDTLKSQAAERINYTTVFENYLQLDPLNADDSTLITCARQHELDLPNNLMRDDYLNLLFTHLIEPHLGFQQPCFIYDYPASQAALARLNEPDKLTAARFEVFVNGIELANGFYELSDPIEQRQRFEKDNKQRSTLASPSMPIDEKLIAALSHGLPDCAGVALGIDRLIMLATRNSQLTDAISFA